MAHLLINFEGELNMGVVQRIYDELSVYVQKKSSSLEQTKQQPKRCIDGACVNCPHYKECIQDSDRLNNFHAGGL